MVVDEYGRKCIYLFNLVEEIEYLCVLQRLSMSTVAMENVSQVEKEGLEEPR